MSGNNNTLKSNELSMLLLGTDGSGALPTTEASQQANSMGLGLGKNKASKGSIVDSKKDEDISEMDAAQASQLLKQKHGQGKLTHLTANANANATVNTNMGSHSRHRRQVKRNYHALVDELQVNQHQSVVKDPHYIDDDEDDEEDQFYIKDRKPKERKMKGSLSSNAVAHTGSDKQHHNSSTDHDSDSTDSVAHRRRARRRRQRLADANKSDNADSDSSTSTGSDMVARRRNVRRPRTDKQQQHQRSSSSDSDSDSNDEDQQKRMRARAITRQRKQQMHANAKQSDTVEGTTHSTQRSMRSEASSSSSSDDDSSVSDGNPANGAISGRSFRNKTTPTPRSSNDDDTQARTIAQPQIRVQTTLKRRRRSESPSTSSSSSSTSSASSSDVSSDDEPSILVQSKPMFVPKHKRKKQQQVLIQQEQQDEQILLQKKQEEKRIRQSRALVAEIVSVELSEKKALEGVMDDQNEFAEMGGSSLPPLDDTDDGPEEQQMKEREDWEVRELLRLLRDFEEFIEVQRDLKELERRRHMTDEERLKEDIESGSYRKPGEQRMQKKDGNGDGGHLQPYFHRGAFYMDDDTLKDKDDIRHKAAEYAKAATGDDKFDKRNMPKVMQVKKFGFAGYGTKYRGLSKEDTTDKTGPGYMRDAKGK